MVKFLNYPEVTYVDSMGSDLSVVNAARVSFNKTEFNPENPQNEKLINYLATHNHWSPFAHCFLTLRIKAPIFSARQLVKHQVGLAWNEVSRRYITEEPEFYIPLSFHHKPDGSIKQGASTETLFFTEWWTEGLKNYSEDALDTYNNALEDGMAPEEARMFLPLNTMTEWIWSGSLMAFARVCNLRLDSHAQGATREVAKKIYNIIDDLFPLSTKALVKIDKDTPMDS